MSVIQKILPTHVVMSSAITPEQQNKEVSEQSYSWHLNYIIQYLCQPSVEGRGSVCGHSPSFLCLQYATL